MYYDLDDISADFERLECTVNFDAEGLGFLTDSQSGPVFKGTVTELPLWLTEPLATTTLTGSTQEFMMTIKRPKFLGNSVINWLKSDATVLDLHRIMPQFYKLAERWLGLFEDRELADVVREALRARAATIYDYASNLRSDQESRYAELFDDFEKSLFRTAQESRKELVKWITKK